jgi:hypothetical protein
MNSAGKPVVQAIAAIEALDLDPIKLKLMDAEEGQGWSRDYVEQMALAYKRYLTLLVKFPEEEIAPTKDVDKFWHAHILDTLKYADDCQSVFGHFLHHFPYFGMRGEQDAANLRTAADNMHRIYEREFGEPIPSGAAWCYAAKPVAQQASAWCYAAEPVAQQASAWCYAAKPVASAWCYAAKPDEQQASAWCYAAKPQQTKTDALTRPTLAPAG